MKRIIGLDYGGKTIGVAVSDEMGWTAQGVETLRRKNECDLSSSINAISAYVNKYNADTIVIGYPKNMNNTEGLRCEKTLKFKKVLAKRLPFVNIVLFDERLSTAAAERLMAEAGISRAKRENIIDKMAAMQILQGYLDCAAVGKKRANNDSKILKIKGVLAVKKDSEDFDKNFDEADGFDGDDGLQTLIMTDEDGNEIEFLIVDELKDNGNTYLLLIESEFAEDEESEATIFKEVIENGDEVVYEEIEDDNEFERIGKLFAENDGDYELG